MVVGGVAFVVVAAVVAVVMVLSGKGKNAGRAATRFGRKAGNAAAGAISALVSVVDDDRSANYNDGYGSDGGYSSAGSAIASEDDYVSDDELAGLGLNAADEGVAAYRRAQAAEAQGRLLDRLGR